MPASCASSTSSRAAKSSSCASSTPNRAATSAATFTSCESPELRGEAAVDRLQHGLAIFHVHVEGDELGQHLHGEVLETCGKHRVLLVHLRFEGRHQGGYQLHRQVLPLQRSSGHGLVFHRLVKLHRVALHRGIHSRERLAAHGPRNLHQGRHLAIDESAAVVHFVQQAVDHHLKFNEEGRAAWIIRRRQRRYLPKTALHSTFRHPTHRWQRRKSWKFLFRNVRPRSP
mmetsp:Transcript_53319/g.152849  ORF Transcript_53319/g.152849 Transcript_53319/m.152849 type:complete len:228 (+) Transcript_53319:363-1046(+)